ncbi:MAG TPA: chemotaxis-specific protein-glutamate methyltransferase CheB [Bryobacteraceae bacterium]|jgi:two-component system chemotaxis response regulator CheB|nr:chemotaxis-specific protein-glutamate methyltransferase CheB [Bryobacteraceae bacterium]
MRPVRVLIVEDSAVVREHLRNIISADPRLQVAGMAGSGEEALAMVDQVAPDVISMDIQLPGIEGFETTRRIMAYRPTPIVVVSGIDMEEVNLTMRALKSGALGVVQKPVSSGHPDYDVIARRLCTQLAIMSEVKVIRRRDVGPRKGEPALLPAVPPVSVSRLSFAATPRVLAVAASTGGPNALLHLLCGLGEHFPLPVVLVQHMTSGFVEGFADWLSEVTPFSACVVNGPTTLLPGMVYVAPSERHLVLHSSGAGLSDAPPVGTLRPSANVLFSSAAKTVGAACIAVLLTGMGEDGAAGMGELNASGAYTLAEDETTAVVYGMPAAAARQGFVRELLPLPGIAPRILSLIAAKNERS